MKYYDHTATVIEPTELSNRQQGLIHLAIKLQPVHSVYVAELIRRYLERQLQTTVGGLHSHRTRQTFLFCFVSGPIACDAKYRVSGLLGPQLERALRVT